MSRIAIATLGTLQPRRTGECHTNRTVRNCDRTILRKQYCATRVVKELSILFANPNYAAKAMEIGLIVQAEDGVGVACDAIQKQLEII